nr:hypothetical protein [Psychrobacter immobilis]
MLYSPLYQSIRLVLFGALGLSSLTVSAALTNADAQTTASLPADTTSSYVSDLTGDINTDANTNVNAINQDISYQRAAAQSSAYEAGEETVNAASESSNLDLGTGSTLDNGNLGITEIANNSDDDAQAQAQTQKKPLAAVSDNDAIDTSDESIQDSLLRLAEFYELTPDTDLSTQNASDKPVESEDDTIQNTLTPATQTIPKVGKNLRLLPNAVDSAQRCEGQWVCPQQTLIISAPSMKRQWIVARRQPI